MVVETTFMQDVFADQANHILLDYTTPRVTLKLSRSQRRGEFGAPRTVGGGG
jgi:hypothetical protein